MIVIALVAVNLALLRAAPIQMIVIPFPWILLGIVDYLLIWKCVLRRPFRAMHYTFLIVFVVAFVVLANLVDRTGFRLLGLIVGWYQRLNGDQTQSMFLREFVSLGEFWMAALLGLSIAYAAGLLAAWSERRRGWDIAALLRGTLIGFGVANVLIIADQVTFGQPEPGSLRMYGRFAVLAISLIAGGLVGLKKLRTKTHSTQGAD